MESKWIEFVEYPTGGVTKAFKIVTRDSGAIIGFVKWYAPWRKYSFFPVKETVFETQCLKDIVRFIDSLMLERKIKKQEANGTIN